jgi:hypothetical protein
MLEKLAANRKIRKAVVEGLLAIAIAVLGIVLDSPELAQGAGGTWALQQIRRVARDAARGEPD